MMLEIMLTDAGARRIEIAGNIAAAMSLIETTPFDIAIFDRQLGKSISYPAAIAAQAKGTVIIIASGAPTLDRPQELADAIVMAKPYTPSELQRAVVAALASRAPAVGRN